LPADLPTRGLFFLQMHTENYTNYKYKINLGVKQTVSKKLSRWNRFLP